MSKTTADNSQKQPRAPRELEMDDDPLAQLFGGEGQRGGVASVPLPRATSPVVAIDRKPTHEAPVGNGSALNAKELPLDQPKIESSTSSKAPSRGARAPSLAAAPDVASQKDASSRSGARTQTVAQLGLAPVPAEHELATGPDASGAGAKSLANRIGTRHEPYTRKKDGIQTRQASTTLPMDLLKRLDHCAIDMGSNRSNLIYDAVCEYLDKRGYTDE